MVFRTAYLVFAAPFRLVLYIVNRMRWSPRISQALGDVGKNVAATVIGGVIFWASVAATAYLANPWRPTWPAPCSGERMCVVIAGLDGDDSGDQTRHIQASLEDAFRNEQGALVVQVITLPRKLQSGFGGDLDKSRQKLEERGQEWLARMDAHVLVYGRVVDDNKVLDLQVLGRDDPRGRGRRYLLSDSLILPNDFENDFGAALAGVATATAVPASETAQSVPILDALGPVSVRLGILTQALPENAGWRSRGAIFYAHAIAEEKLGLQSGVNPELHLRSSISSYLNATKEFEGRSPTDWGRSQHGLGNALAAFGNLKGEPAHLKEAISAFQNALSVRTPTSDPTGWILSQIGLASTLTDLGQLQESSENFEKAEAILSRVVTIGGPTISPVQRASALFALGSLQMAWGQREEAPERLIACASSFQQSAAAASRVRAPLLWAAATVSSGDCSVVLGFRTGDVSHYARAVEAYRSARSEFHRDLMPIQWARTFGSEGQALQGWGETLEDTQIIAASVSAYRQAVIAYDRDRFPVQWSEGQDRLSAALTSLAERQGGQLVHSREAIAAARAALEERPRERLPFLWARTQRHLGQALTIHGERSADPESLQSATATLDAALTRLPKDVYPLEWAETMIAAGRARVSLATLQSDSRRCFAGASLMSSGIEVYEGAGVPADSDKDLLSELRFQCGSISRLGTRTSVSQ